MCQQNTRILQVCSSPSRWKHSGPQWLPWSEAQWIWFWLEKHQMLITNTSRERISKPSEAWEGFPQMVPMDMAVPGFLKWFFARKSLSSSRVLIRLYTWVCTQADKVQSFFYRIDPNSRDPLKIFRCWSMRGWHRLTGKTGREAGEVNGSNDCKFTTLNEEKF